MRKITYLAAFGLAAVASSGGGWAQADNYPGKPVRIISPFPPGGSVDLVGRLLGVRLSEALGQQFVVDNRTGASGTIGTELAMRAAPDGYTLLVNTLPIVTNMFLFSRAHVRRGERFRADLAAHFVGQRRGRSSVAARALGA